jgi:ankyrin repeat protein
VGLYLQPKSKNMLEENSTTKLTPDQELVNAAERGDANAVTALLDQGVNVNAITEYGGGALHAAAQYGRAAIVEILLNRGADINLLTLENGWTALHFAAQKGYVSIVKLLLAHKSDVKIAGLRYRRTPLHYAAEQGHIEIVETLLAAGSSSTAIDIAGHNAADIAKNKNHTHIAKIITNFKSFDK